MAPRQREESQEISCSFSGWVAGYHKHLGDMWEAPHSGSGTHWCLRVLLGRLEDMPGSAPDYQWHESLEPHRAHIIEVRKEGARVQLGLLLMN